MNLIIGASGTLGSIVAQQLPERGEAVRAMSRTPERVAELETMGAQVVQGDLRDPASLYRACAGATTVIAAAHSLFGRGAARFAVVDDQRHRGLIDAAKAAGVQQFVYISGRYFDEHGEFFDLAPILQQYPVPLTSLEAWVHGRVAGQGES